MRQRLTKRWILLAIFVGVFVWVIANMQFWEAMLGAIFPNEPRVTYPEASLLVLVGQHIRLVAVSSSLTISIGIPLGVWVTRSSGRSFLAITSDLTSFAQAFPPVAVLALTVPLLGFGTVPTVVALFLYGLLPVVGNTIAGISAVPRNLLDAAFGMGMGNTATLFRVELPMAAKVIMAGVRISVIINVGTAMIGAVIGAGGLGSPIVAGLVQDNIALVVEGAAPAAILAILIDQLMNNLEETFFSYREH